MLSKLSGIETILQKYKQKETLINGHIANDEDIENLIKRYLDDTIEWYGLESDYLYRIYTK